jgi:hypothetical protein
MEMKVTKRYGCPALGWLLFLGLIWLGPQASQAREENAPGYNQEEPAPTPGFQGLVAQEEDEQGLDQEEPAPTPGPQAPGMNRPGPGMGPRGRHAHQPLDRPIRDRQGMGPGKGLGKGLGMGPGGGRRFDEILERMKTENPERYARIQKIRELADQYRKATDAQEKKKIEKDLRPLLETELKQVQTDNQKKLEELQSRLEDEKRKQKEREQNWNGYVDFQFNRVTGQGDYLELPIGPWK